MTCKQDQERVEEEVLQAVDQWVEQQEQRCREEECNWWVLCTNKLVCWFVSVFGKVTIWVVTIVVRWVYRIVCTVVKVLFGLVLAPFDKAATLGEGVGDVVELIKDVFYFTIGAVIYYGLYIVDAIQTGVGLQQRKRRLTPSERRTLYPIFRDSLVYDAIRVVEGNAGLLGISGQAFTMGWTIYMPTLDNETLVHECVHVWQFQFEGTRYIGNSVLNQLDQKIFSPGYDPYIWDSRIDAGATWYTLKSPEAQAQLIEDVFIFGESLDPPDTSPGASSKRILIHRRISFFFTGKTTQPS